MIDTTGLPKYVNIIIVGKNGNFRRYRKLNHNSFSPTSLKRILLEGDVCINVYGWLLASPLGKNRGSFIKKIVL